MVSNLIFQTHPKGKLLLTGEYSVLDGALTLALPTIYGQSFKAFLTETSKTLIHWISTDENGNIWFQATFLQHNLDIVSTTDEEKATQLQQLLRVARASRPHFLRSTQGIEVHTALDFPRDWGLGTSSTLVAAVGHWAGVSPYVLLKETFGGSGYDLACAYAGAAVLFRKLEQGGVDAKWTAFHPSYSHHLYFVYLGNKQNSRDGIAQYKSRVFDKAELAHLITCITQEVLAATKLATFSACLVRHEQLISDALSMPTVQSRLFPGFQGVVKSLGAWGGDFVLACSDLEEHKVNEYFLEKGFGTVLNYDRMVLY